MKKFKNLSMQDYKTIDGYFIVLNNYVTALENIKEDDKLYCKLWNEMRELMVKLKNVVSADNMTIKRKVSDNGYLLPVYVSYYNTGMDKIILKIEF